MANLSNRLVAGVVKKAAAPAPASLSPASSSSTATTHPEKITHAVTKLAAAGLGSTSSTSNSPNHHSSNTKWIIIGAVAGGVALIAIILLAWVLYRRYQKKRAYAMVSRGVDMTGTPAWRVTSPEGENTGPRPLFLNRGMGAATQQDREEREPFRGRGMSVGGLGSHPTSGGRSRSHSATPIIGGRNRTSMGGEEMFNQDREMDLASGMMEQGRKISEANFESGYDVDTGYEGAGTHGDKRSMGA